MAETPPKVEAKWLPTDDSLPIAASELFIQILGRNVFLTFGAMRTPPLGVGPAEVAEIEAVARLVVSRETLNAVSDALAQARVHMDQNAKAGEKV